MAVILDAPVPAALAGKAGFNLEFLPTAYFHHSYMADGRTGTFPLYPADAMTATPERNAASGRNEGPGAEPTPIAQGNRFVLAPEDPARRVTISSTAPVQLFDGRNQAQNGWFVLRSLLPTGRTGTVLEWTIQPNSVPGWLRPPVIAHSQLGYTPDRAQDRDDRTRSQRPAHAARAPAAHRRRRADDAGPHPAREALGRVPALQLSPARFQRGPRSRPVRTRIRTHPHRPVPHRRRCLCRCVAPDARRVFSGRDGPHVRQRRLPRVARRCAPRRCAAGTRRSRAYRPLSTGADHRHRLQAGRAHPRPGDRRLVRRGRFRHPHPVAISGRAFTGRYAGNAGGRRATRPRSTGRGGAPRCMCRTARPTCSSKFATAHCNWSRSSMRSVMRSTASSSRMSRNTRTSAMPRPRPTALSTIRR